MSKEATATASVTPLPKTRKPRSPSKPRKIFAVVQVIDAEGNPVKVAGGTVKLIQFCKSADKVLDLIDGGKVEHGLYLSGMLDTSR